MTDAVTVLIADDHPLFRKGLVEVLDPDPSFRIVGEAGDGDTALALVRRHQPDIALLDIEMPKMGGLEVAATIRREGLVTRVVMLTMYRDAGIFRQALDLGARGYVLKDSAAVEIVACLHTVASGRAYMSPELSQELLERRTERLEPAVAGLGDLTPSERRVLQLVASGLTTQEIAERLDNSPKTIENHRSHICQKLGLDGPQPLLRFALEHRNLLE